MREKLFNLWLRFRYRYLNPDQELYPTGECVLEKFTFNEISPFIIKDGEFYNNNDVWFSKDKVSTNNLYDLVIDCEYQPGTHESWQGKRDTNWISGMVETPVLINYGTWIIEAKLPKSWPAIWLLRERHNNPEGVSTITPEVDIMEVIHGNFQHTIHFSPDSKHYSTDGRNNKLKYDDKFHEFAVDLRKDGYDFYIDGILTGRFRGKGNIVDDSRLYLILNNAANRGDTDHKVGDNYRMEVRSVRVYKNEFTTKTGDDSPWKK